MNSTSSLRIEWPAQLQKHVVDSGGGARKSMVKITYVAHDGTERVVNAEPGFSLMEVARHNNVVGIDGDCGGACACGTCQVRVEPMWLGKLKEKAPGEEGMLEYAERSGLTSRLSCQIIVTEEMDGLVVHMPQNQH